MFDIGFLSENLTANNYCMENFIVSARKYRPVTFDSVVGQDVVTTTLKNAIKSNHLAQAYLFCGPRGVGKTTCARILAKTINCSNITEDIEACDKCESCLSFNESRSYNIHELDAASNNSVDDIRNLIDQVRIPPQVGKYSIYIIDEVHMLSAQAFNAFLKTLEEPPKHAIFILATTEKHKIIPTILSRCQIFDFNRIKINDIVQRLQFVADKENVVAEGDALHIIAQKAEGAMRDALSIFDQIVSFSGSEISYKNVIENLNVLDYDYYFRLTDAFLSNDATSSLLMLDEIMTKGFDPHHLITGLSSHLRDILVCKDPETIELLEAGASFRERYLNQSRSCSVDFLFRSLEILSLSDVQFRQNKNPRLHTELTLIKICRITDTNAEVEAVRKPAVNKVGKSESVKPEEKAEPKKMEVPEHVLVNPKVKVEVEVEKAAPKVHEFKSKYQHKTTSIKDGLKGSINLEKDSDSLNDLTRVEKVIRVKPFTVNDLQEHWLGYSESIKNEKPRLSITLRTQMPKLEDNFRIIVNLDNTNQEEDFQRYVKMDILTFLKEKLENDKISIETVLTEVEEGNKKPYTDEEKFKFLSDKNPNLKILKQQLGLDFE